MKRLLIKLLSWCQRTLYTLEKKLSALIYPNKTLLIFEDMTVVHDDWPTKQQDLQTAEQIIKEYVDEFGAEDMVKIELVYDADGEHADLHAPPWLTELAAHYDAKYGQDKGDVITRRVLTQCLVGEQTVH